MNTVSHLPAKYICPICRQALQQVKNSYQCDNGHNFDCAKEGYVNLLVVQQKKSKNPGDNKTMIVARKSFLDKGYYDIIIDPCKKLIADLGYENSNLLDIGCGDGYFTQQIIGPLNFQRAYALDISKDAIKIAAKRHKQINWLVASGVNIPIEKSHIDVILKINAPLNYEVAANLLNQNGIIISITPGSQHLYEFKQLIYQTPQTHQAEEAPAQFKSIKKIELEGKICLTNNTDIQNLFVMTPYYWNASTATKEKVATVDRLETQIAFTINVWQAVKD